MKDASVAKLLREFGYQYREEPFRLASGELSHDYVDGKKAISTGDHLKFVAEAILEVAEARGIDFDSVGGLTMGADPLAHAIALLAGVQWFSVRKEPKQHGKGRSIEGSELTPSNRVLLVDDVVTSGQSIIKALDAVEELGAKVVLATCLLDRGDGARRRLAERKIPYQPLATYTDLGIAPVGG